MRLVLITLLSFFSLPFAHSEVISVPYGTKHILLIKGIIDETTSQKVEAVAIAAESEEITLELDSLGGSVVEAQKIQRRLQMWKAAGKRLTTIVQNGKSCGSMCLPLFAQGDVRRAGPAAAFMFHSAQFTIVGIAGFGGQSLNQEAFFRPFLEAGVSSQWLDNLIANHVFETPQMYWLTGRDLIEDQSGLVTELLPRLEPSKSIEVMGVKIWF